MKLSAAMRRLGTVVGVLVIAVTARGDDSALLTQPTIDALTAIDESPTSAELSNVLVQPAVTSLVTIALGDPSIDPGVQLRAIQALTQYTSDASDLDSSRTALLSLLATGTRYAIATSGTDVLILRAALSALGTVSQGANSGDWTIIAPFLNHGSRDVRTSAARALRDLGNSQAIPALRTRYGVETVQQVRLAISEALRVLPQQEP